jgi:purine-binding chemotaxis protein CheW
MEIANSPGESGCQQGTYVSFRVANLFFGVDVSNVQEILRHQAMTPVPLAAPYISGLVNLRGQIITAIDLRSLLKLGDGKKVESPMNVVVKSGEEKVSLVVDSIGDVIEVDPNTFEAVPQTVPGHIRSLLGGVFKLERELLLVIEGLKNLESQGV